MPTLPLNSPKVRYFDGNGDPLAGGKLYSYAAGTSTPLDTFTTWAGTIANANPVILDANGEADVWTTPGLLYKFVLRDSLGVIQWTVDNVPSGSGGSTSTTTDTAGSVDPGGRLTLTSGAPVTTSDVAGAIVLFYTPMSHNRVPLYDGAGWTLHAIATELSQATSDATKSPAATAPSSVYDVFIWDDSGTLRLSRGPVWASDTSRGTGSGTTELDRVDGRLLNRYAISNGPAASRGLYVGTVRSEASTQLVDSMAKRYVWNAYNRVRRPMRLNDPAVGWTYATDVWRQANGNAGNQVAFVLGLSREPVRAEVLAVGRHDALAASTGHVQVGIGLDSSTVNSAGVNASIETSITDVDTSNSYLLTATYDAYPDIGRHVLTWLERGVLDVAGTLTWYGQGGALNANSGIVGHLMA